MAMLLTMMIRPAHLNCYEHVRVASMPGNRSAYTRTRPLHHCCYSFGQAAWNTDGTAQGGDQQSTPLLVDAGFNNANTVSAGAATTCIRNTSGVALCSGAAPLRGNEAVPPGVALPLACEWAGECVSQLTCCMTAQSASPLHPTPVHVAAVPACSWLW